MKHFAYTHDYKNSGTEVNKIGYNIAVHNPINFTTDAFPLMTQR